MVELYLHSPICLHGVIRNYVQGQLCFYRYIGCSHIEDVWEKKE
jgi:hypothetical protein